MTPFHIQSWDAIQTVYFQLMVVVPVPSSVVLDNYHCPHLLLVPQTDVGRWSHSNQWATSPFIDSGRGTLRFSLQFVVKSNGRPDLLILMLPRPPIGPKVALSYCYNGSIVISGQNFIVGSGHWLQWCRMAQNDDIISTDSKLFNISRRKTFHRFFPRETSSPNIHRSHLHCLKLPKHWK